MVKITSKIDENDSNVPINPDTTVATCEVISKSKLPSIAKETSLLCKEMQNRTIASNPKMSKVVHLPCQSGSNKILEAMTILKDKLKSGLPFYNGLNCTLYPEVRLMEER